jgi:uncharacterized protein DUF6980
MSILSKDHCCETMDRILQRGSSALFYKSNIRKYRIWEIIFGKNSIELGMCNSIRYCPWCASKLPESLGDEIEETLAREFGITESWEPEQAARIPAEFQTDEWWKKRGL